MKNTTELIAGFFLFKMFGCHCTPVLTNSTLRCSGECYSHIYFNVSKLNSANSNIALIFIDFILALLQTSNEDT